MSAEKSDLEKFYLVWLDKNVKKSKKYVDAEEQLRKSLKYLHLFEDIDQCELYIRFIPINDRIVLIVSEDLGQLIVPRIDQLQQISSIYIYDQNKTIEKQWIKKYLKVKGVMTTVDDLIKEIQSNHSRQNRKKVDEPMVFNVFNASSTSEQSTTGLNGQFVQAQLFLNCLLRIEATPTDKDELISLSKKQYGDSENDLSIIGEFEENYSSDRALWWYTRESFLYRQLNKALRIQNIDSLYVFRFFIRDLEKQLKEHQYLSSIRVFRGQLMSNQELELLTKSIGQLISMNSFLSTSIDRRLAISFLYSSTPSEGMQRVLFQIDADPQLEGIRPFANITSRSYFPGEDEVLFMLGSIFRLNSIDRDESGIWIFRLTLCGNSDANIQSVFDHMKNAHGSGETTLLSVGIILHQMGKYDDAEKYFRHLLNELPEYHWDRAACYLNLGNVCDEKGNYQASLDWHKKALQTMMQTLPPYHPNFGICYNSIAAVHSKLGNYEQAIEAYMEAFKNWIQLYGEDHPNIALCFSNIAGIYMMHEKFSDALENLQKALIISEKHFPVHHPHLGMLQNNIGTVYLCLHNLDLALEHLTKSLQINERSLPDEHPDIAMAHSNIGLIYEEKEQWEQALSYLTKARNIYRQSLPPTHPRILQVERLIERVSTKSKME